MFHLDNDAGEGELERKSFQLSTLKTEDYGMILKCIYNLTSLTELNFLKTYFFSPPSQ